MMIRKYELDYSFQINKVITLLSPIMDISGFPWVSLIFQLIVN